MKHRTAVLLMILVTLLWSSAGVVSRQLEEARSFEVTFWRSAFNAGALVVLLSGLRGLGFWRQLARADRSVWASGLCWAVMFTAFMIAISLTAVANVLVTMALGPLLTALFARVFLGQRIPRQTWIAIGVATVGIAWMFGHEARWDAGFGGVLVALGVPLAAASNWCVLQATHAREEGGDLLPAVLIGAVLSAAVTLPLAWPLQASPHDLGLLAGLGAFQLAVPCLLVVRLSRELPGHELALLGLLEVILGVLWAWVFAGERPSDAALVGGGLVLGALAGNELLQTRTQTA
jgi:drug/metabolite transporter (DMT)-like permease